ncbi:hypothetical protein HaLaN_08605 [Haematococcus lacustris]|uniref:Uncharacterized protein n=1 Tax=Haematococcus lacustris TaxID=44745 RepID=A0A699YRM7_HAELA|nr:hypothetical protein HaLaN_08605 [Haematococcus lacustris]
MTAQPGGHTTVPQQAAAPGPLVACLAAACTPGLGTPCPWLAASPALASSTAPVGATCSHQCTACSALHCSPCPATCLMGYDRVCSQEDSVAEYRNNPPGNPEC